MQVVWAGPDVGERQRPEVHHRQAIGIHGTFRLLWNEVVHDAEKTGGQKEAYCVVAVPPLDHRILYASVNGIRLERGNRHRCAVDDMQQGNRQDERTEEPVGDIDVFDLTCHDRAEKHDCVGHPDDGDQYIDRPFQFSVFLGGGDTQGQSDRREHDHGLPAPEGKGRELVRDQPGVAGTLHHVVRGCEQRGAAKGENNRIGVQRTQTAEGQPGYVEVQYRPCHLRSDKYAHSHAHDTPHHGHDRELFDDFIVIGSSFVTHMSILPNTKCYIWLIG